MKLIGIGGTNGSGKDTLGKIIAEEFGYVFISLTESLRDEAERRGLPPDRLNTRTISQEWREERGLAVLVDMMLEKHAKSENKEKGLVTSSLRNGAEPDRVHELDGLVVWIDSPVEVRYERVTTNKRARRGVDDEKTLEQFIADENIEMYGREGDPITALRSIDVKNKSDIILMNDFETIEEFRSFVVETLQPYIEKL